jgi:cell wall-associated NlpC family hydrolase
MTPKQPTSPDSVSAGPCYSCRQSLNLYDSPALERLATQAIAQRQLCLLPEDDATSAPAHPQAIPVRLCEDDYPGWLAAPDRVYLDPVTVPYQPAHLTRTEIEQRIPGAIAVAHAAMAQPNHYLWGGTTPPHFDCSGLMQMAFASVGVWLPRDAYQQEAFAQPIPLAELQPGDLVFFGPPQKATHVGLYLGDRRYLHSSGQDQGNNGIAINVLSDDHDPVSSAYFRQFRQAGRILTNYQSRFSRVIDPGASR